MSFLIKNSTPYLGKIVLRFERHPDRLSRLGYRLNKVHADFFFFKLVSRIKCLAPGTETEEMVNPQAVQLIEMYTGGKIRDNVTVRAHVDQDDGLHEETLLKRNAFVTFTGEYIGDLDLGWFYYTNKLVVVTTYFDMVAAKKDDNWRNTIGFAAICRDTYVLFRIGDKVFNCNWVPILSEVKLQWANSYFINKKIRPFHKLKWAIDYLLLHNISLKELLPFIPATERGALEIKTLCFAELSARNLAHYMKNKIELYIN